MSEGRGPVGEGSEVPRSLVDLGGKKRREQMIKVSSSTKEAERSEATNRIDNERPRLEQSSSSPVRAEVFENGEVGRRKKLEVKRSESIEKPDVGGEESGAAVAHSGSQTITERGR